jgi:hypothetical protein
MVSVARYLLAGYTRSRGFVAPLAVLVGGVIVLYAQPPNPVLSTAGSVAAFLFPVQCWMSLALYNAAGSGERHILAATTGGLRLAGGRILAAGALALAASLLALVIPLIGGAFERTPHLDETALILAANLTSTLAAAGLAVPFSAPTVRSGAISILGLATFIVLTVPLRVPPLVPVARALDTTHVGHATTALAGPALVVAIFALAIAPLGGLLWRRRE